MKRLTETKIIPNILSAADELADADWQFLNTGVMIHYLYRDDLTGAAAAFIRYAPGTEVNAHQHLGYEQVIVLEGEQSDELHSYRQGCMAIQPPGSKHKIKSSKGCTVLAIWTAPLKFTLAQP